MRLLLVASVLASGACAFFFGTIPPVQNAYARPQEGAAPAACAPCEPPTFAPLPTFAPIELPTFAPLPTLPPFEWPTLPPAPAAAAGVQGYVQPPKPLELPTAAPLVLPTLAPIEFPTLPPFELPKAPDAYIQPKPVELPTLAPLVLPTLAPFELPTFPPLPPAAEYVMPTFAPLPTLAPFEFPKLPDTYVQPKPLEFPTAAPLVLPTMAPIELPTLPPFEFPKAPDAYVQPKPLQLPTLAPLVLPTLAPFELPKAPEPVYVQPLEFPTFPPLPTMAPFEWPTFAPLALPTEGYATAPPQYVVPKTTNDVVTESGAVGGVESSEAATADEAVAPASEVAKFADAAVPVPVAEAAAEVAAPVDNEVVAPPPALVQTRWERAPADCEDFLGYLTSIECWLEYQNPVPEGVVRPEIPTEKEAFIQTNTVSDADLVEHDKPTFEAAVATSKLRLRRGSRSGGIMRISSA